MPDITMCQAYLCPDSTRCHRHADSGTVPSQVQSYRALDGEQKLGAKGCEMFWPKERRPDMAPADALMEIFGFTRAENEEDGDMKRYTLDAHTQLYSDGMACNAVMLETADGEYVRYDAAQAEIQRLQRALSQAVDAQLDLANRLHALQAENERLIRRLSDSSLAITFHSALPNA